MSIERKGKFLKRLFCEHDWTFVYDPQWPHCGTHYYKWCDKCDRLERLGFIYESAWKEEREEQWKEMGLPPFDTMTPYCCHPDYGKDLIQMRIDAGFRKEFVV